MVNTLTLKKPFTSDLNNCLQDCRFADWARCHQYTWKKSLFYSNVMLRCSWTVCVSYIVIHYSYSRHHRPAVCAHPSAYTFIHTWHCINSSDKLFTWSSKSKTRVSSLEDILGLKKGSKTTTEISLEAPMQWIKRLYRWHVNSTYLIGAATLLICRGVCLFESNIDRGFVLFAWR